MEVVAEKPGLLPATQSDPLFTLRRFGAKPVRDVIGDYRQADSCSK
jgi:hypothetical protein